MQLKKPLSIRHALALATSSLLTLHAHGANGVDNKNFNLSQLYYSEEDRVSVNKTEVTAIADVSDNDNLKVDVVYDSITGASPNGRIQYAGGQVAANVITSTTASGTPFAVNNTLTGADNTQLLTNFTDARKAASLDWSRDWLGNPGIKTILGVNASTENDYRSQGASVQLSLDLDQRRTTFNAGAAFSADTVSPAGGIHEGLGLVACIENTKTFQPYWIHCAATPPTYKPGEKTVANYLIGITQIWNRHTVVQVNYSHGELNGYLTDPYKQISVINDTFGGEVSYLYEKRPDSRSTNSVYVKLVHVPAHYALNASLRFFWDDWGIRALTGDGRVHIDTLPQQYLQLHMRLSAQSTADFYADSIDADKAKEPTFVSADHRLSRQYTATAGVKYALDLSADSNLALRFEYMRQIYVYSSLPTMNATIAQLLYTKRF